MSMDYRVSLVNWLVLSVLILYCIRRPLTTVFTTGAAVITMCVDTLWLYSLFIPLDHSCSVSSGGPGVVGEVALHCRGYEPVLVWCGLSGVAVVVFGTEI